eukprot:6185187-Pleurochrysis_carterae.AAC.1
MKGSAPWSSTASAVLQPNSNLVDITDVDEVWKRPQPYQELIARRGQPAGRAIGQRAALSNFPSRWICPTRCVFNTSALA